MNGLTLFFDEIRGFARSKVMLVLWIGLPALTVLMRVFRPDADGMPLFSLVAILIASIGGTLSAVILSTAITSERNRHVYDLFLIRPVGRGTLILAKYFAAFVCLLAATALSMALGAAVDAASGMLAPGVVAESMETIAMSMSGIAIACAVGVLFGILINSVAVSAILAVYIGNQLSAVVILPVLFVEGLNVPLFAVGVGIVVPALLLWIAIAVFQRKSL
jgi:ABC-2 type transport system permease protein